MQKLDAESLSNSICETIEKLGVDLMLCIAQCYDGRSLMSREYNGVQAKFKGEGASCSCTVSRP